MMEVSIQSLSCAVCCFLFCYCGYSNFGKMEVSLFLLFSTSHATSTPKSSPSPSPSLLMSCTISIPNSHNNNNKKKKKEKKEVFRFFWIKFYFNISFSYKILFEIKKIQRVAPLLFLSAFLNLLSPLSPSFTMEKASFKVNSSPLPFLPPLSLSPLLSPSLPSPFPSFLLL